MQLIRKVQFDQKEKFIHSWVYVYILDNYAFRGLHLGTMHITFYVYIHEELQRSSRQHRIGGEGRVYITQMCDQRLQLCSCYYRDRTCVLT